MFNHNLFISKDFSLYSQKRKKERKSVDLVGMHLGVLFLFCTSPFNLLLIGCHEVIRLLVTCPPAMMFSFAAGPK